MRSPCPRLFALATCTAMVAHAADAPAAQQPPPPRPAFNIVLVVADDHGADAGCYGNPKIRTPNLDRLAREGIVFDRAYATASSCSPSRAVILSGIHAHANGQYGLAGGAHRFETREKVRSLPLLLMRAGYQTARIGKLHVAPAEVYPFEQVLTADTRDPVAMAKAARSFLRGSHRFFLYFATADPHRGGPVDDSDGAPNAFGNRPGDDPDRAPFRYSPDDVVVPPFLPDSPECRAELAQYYESVSRVDRGVGQLIAELEAAGRWNDTVLVYTSDHGVAFPGAKTTVYEPGLRVPLIVRVPGLADPGSRRDALVGLVDLMPTLLEYTPSDYDLGKLQGRSFAPLIADGKLAGPARFFASHTFHEITMHYPMRVVRTERHKLIWNLAHELSFPFAEGLWDAPTWQAAYAGGPDARYGQRTIDAYLHRPEFELYDLETDPNEANNLAYDDEHRALRASLEAELREFQQRTEDPWLVQWRERTHAGR